MLVFGVMAQNLLEIGLHMLPELTLSLTVIPTLKLVGIQFGHPPPFQIPCLLLVSKLNVLGLDVMGFLVQLIHQLMESEELPAPIKLQGLEVPTFVLSLSLQV